MGRRKHKIYRKEWFKPAKQISRLNDVNTSPQSTPISPAFSRTNEKPPATNTTTVNPTAEYHGFLPTYTPRKRHGSLQRTKAKVVRVCLLNAGINWVVTILGYVVIQQDQKSLVRKDVLEVSFKGIIYFLSLLQATLIVSYWDLSLRYTEQLRCAMHCNASPIQKLRQSPSAMVKCAVEIGLHLIAPIPNVSSEWTVAIFGSVSQVSIDDLLYFVILIRNYHSMRLLYWHSRFADMKTHFFASVANISFGDGFLFRCFLADYHMILILGIFGIMVIFSGIVEYVFEKASSRYLSNQWNVFWIVTSTQVTIGYGDGRSITFLGQVTMLISCFFGVFTLGLLNTLTSRWLVLNLTECNLYSELLYRRQKELHEQQAATLVQTWWRLMLMRMSHTISGYTVVSFYSQLRAYRSVLVDCQRDKDARFERQIEAFDKSTRRRIRPLNEYLRPVVDNHSLVHFTQILDLIRNQYRIKTQCKDVCRLARRLRGKEESVCGDTVEDVSEAISRGRTCRSWRSPRPVSEHSGQEKAKAKITAFQNVMGRLIKEESLPTLDDRKKSIL